jgi:hypothetical protein
VKFLAIICFVSPVLIVFTKQHNISDVPNTAREDSGEKPFLDTPTDRSRGHDRKHCGHCSLLHEGRDEKKPLPTTLECQKL